MQSLQEPKASRLSEAHKLGISIPTIEAALIIDVPSGTDISMPSI